jgi:hypothetical protein
MPMPSERQQGGLIATAPLSPRYGGQATWSGSEFLVTGGSRGEGQTAFRSGAAYDPATNRWRTLAIQPPNGNAGGHTHWTGDRLLIPTYHFVPREGASRLSMLTYDPARDLWDRTDYGRSSSLTFASVWTGTEVLLWGSDSYSNDQSGLSFNVTSKEWSELPAAPISGRVDHSFVWTGTEAIVWGGTFDATRYNDGAAYSPDSRTWRHVAEAPIAARFRHGAAWTGDQMIIYGGSAEDDGSGYNSPWKFLGDAATYDPSTDAWTTIPDAPLEPRIPAFVGWTGDRLIVLFGSINEPPFDDYCIWHISPAMDGALYDPDARAWTPVPLGPLSPRFEMSVASAGSDYFVWGGRGYADGGFGPFADGALFDSAHNSWRNP